MERQGISSVGLVHIPFEKLAGMQAIHLGMPDAPFLIYPQDLPSKDAPELVAAKAKEVAEGIAKVILR
jgi:hypothetical protein